MYSNLTCISVVNSAHMYTYACLSADFILAQSPSAHFVNANHLFISGFSPVSTISFQSELQFEPSIKQSKVWTSIRVTTFSNDWINVTELMFAHDGSLHVYVNIPLKNCWCSCWSQNTQLIISQVNIYLKAKMIWEANSFNRLKKNIYIYIVVYYIWKSW